MFAFLPVSATSQINAVQMLVRLVTSKPASSALHDQARQGASAIELIADESKPEADLWQIGPNGDTPQKEAELIWEVLRVRAAAALFDFAYKRRLDLSILGVE